MTPLDPTTEAAMEQNGAQLEAQMTEREEAAAKDLEFRRRSGRRLRIQYGLDLARLGFIENITLDYKPTGIAPSVTMLEAPPEVLAQVTASLTEALAKLSAPKGFILPKANDITPGNPIV